MHEPNPKPAVVAFGGIISQLGNGAYGEASRLCSERAAWPTDLKKYTQTLVERPTREVVIIHKRVRVFVPVSSL